MSTKGSVTLVGAGCDRGLITAEGLTILRNADVVVYDALLDERLLGEVKPSAGLIFVGKRHDNHSRSQQEINEILLREALSGKDVVRLKGGDAFVFGRGSEEALYLQEAGVTVRTVPGVTSCVAVPEHFGIPVTHRGVASSFTVITGHGAGDTEEDYDALAKLTGTLVFLMGLKKAAEISEKLIRAGKPKDTPVSVLSRGFSKYEKRKDGTLESLSELARDAETPAIIVVGKVSAMKASIPVVSHDRKILVVGTKTYVERQAAAFIGERVYKYPILDILPEPSALPDSFEKGDLLVFSSANGVRVFFGLLREAHRDLRELMEVRFACIGPGTAQELKEHGFLSDHMPESYTTLALGKLLGRIPVEGRILLLRSEDGNRDLNEELNRAGLSFRDYPIYHTVVKTDLPILPQDLDEIVFGSAAGVSAFLSLYPTYFSEHDVLPVCIGPVTEARFFEMTGLHGKVPRESTVEEVAVL
ncbi:MAG: uroporphyrinogen-III C-methyltransferase [Lachnospiraceae bacterium]|nr:uroporphyrinogen-III C-methyltransferase [Lachnospiraceae bacterium]